MVASACTSVNGDATQIAHVVTFGSVVTIALTSTTDVKNVTFSFLSDSTGNNAFPDITVTGHGTAQFTMVSNPGDGTGRGLLLQTIVNYHEANQAVSTTLIGSVGTAGVVPLCPGETVERHPYLGWVKAINQALGL